MSYEISEMQRMQANMIRIGSVSALDAANARIKVNVAGLTTDWLPWLVSRAGATRTWSAPRPGEQVVVLAPYGDMAQGVVLPSIYQDDHPAPAASQDVESVVYPDGAKQEHNSASSEYLLDVPAGGKITIRCGPSSIELSDAGIKIIGPRIDLNE